ncbi:uroporphyrin-III C-methyltransferase [Sporocytophaga myxococcoides]|uniref:uroporphyrinogen-III C-methyltransferase n=1 Tax=Sporocytophaga myxococcoides TaxID=153721 RepID=A0A098LJW4_9BACT|nr:uroporphyrinogen-III C-methyltransferase [Sporocytophaga myxococcoides]GAL86473.1 uroporphyrin-III C-methyltransferase [Sporocytophaga myxococcoides]
MKSARLTLVGAGPGDPELITLKGIKALAEADVVLYDALIHPEILNHIPANTPKVFVGKKKGVCQFPQEDINKLIVEHAFKYGHVVRLKGGDPFIFGRGHEELVYAQSFDIPTTVIPGISSSIAVPELQGIPLTRRGVNDSFWVLTGTTRNHELSSDIEIAARSNATVVILMGMTKLKEIVSIFQEQNKGEIPVAVIQNGTMPDEKIGLGTIDTIVDVVDDLKLSSPAVIVIGKVVDLHPDFVNEFIYQEKVRLKDTKGAMNTETKEFYRKLFNW